MWQQAGFYRKLTLIGYLGLLALVILWHSWIAPSDIVSKQFMLVLWVTPLLFPLRGIIKGTPYTHAWANFVLILYFLHSLSVLYTHPEVRWLAVIELILTSMAFIGATFYARYKGRELGLGLKKKGAKTDAETEVDNQQPTITNAGKID